MTERFRPSPDFDDIPRRSPSHEIRVNGEPLELTWYNTQFIVYSNDAYRGLDHVQVATEGQRTSVLFNSYPLIEALIHADYPGSIHPEPTPEVLQLYYRYQSHRLEQDLSSLGDEQL